MKRSVANAFALLLALVAAFLACWVVVPPPDLRTLALGATIPELAALTIPVWLVLFIAVTAIARGAARVVAQALIALAIGLAAVPFVLLPATVTAADAAMTRAFGPDWRVAAPDRVRARMRPGPFSLAEAYRGERGFSVRVERDVPVAVDGGTLALDVYHPAGAGAHPALIVLYGGAWIFGSRADTTELDRSFARLGYVAIAVDYRHAPAFHFPTQRDDVRAALTVIAAHTRAWSIDPARIGLLGRSAGAQLALLAAYEPGPLHIAGVVGEYAPTDLLAGYADPPVPDPAGVRRILHAYLGGTPRDLAARYARASPLLAVRANLPPTLLVIGNRDELVRPRFQRTMRDALTFHGDRVVAIELPWSNHAFDTIPGGIGGQLVRYYTQRFLAATL